jgi:hypothetical protein
MAKPHTPSGHGPPPPRTRRCKHGRRFGNCEKCDNEAITERRYKENKAEQDRFSRENRFEPIITVWEGREAEEQVFNNEPVKVPPPIPKNAGKSIGGCALCGFGIFRGHKVISRDFDMVHRDCCTPCSHDSDHLIIMKYRRCPACKGKICLKCSTYRCPIKEAEREAAANTSKKA